MLSTTYSVPFVPLSTSEFSISNFVIYRHCVGKFFLQFLVVMCLVYLF
jgi:hypothetical protein